MALSESKRRILEAIKQNVIQGIIEDKMKQGQSPDLKWMNEVGFHFRQKKRTKLAAFFKRVMSKFIRNHRKDEHLQNVVRLESLNKER
ncbi:hypothetical protein [Neobacillus sp. 114]|uniref:hypothetical protein n=1 Tax=Neobacillus sp. 114 TaxID=3048535 RepID=UPI0024C35779|nr:hypothetical protein [Neobacillus sp. 114]